MRWLKRYLAKTITVKVLTFKSDFEFSIPVKSTGKDLFDLVCGTFGIKETWYFGLQLYVLLSDGSVKYLNWLKPDKVLCQHPLPLQLCYFFHAKFYPEDIEHELIQPITKHLFYLEVKDKIENRDRLGHLGGSAFIRPLLEAAIQLTVLSARIEFEDFGENEMDDETEQLALSKRLLRLLPKYLSVSIQVNTGIAQRLKESYMNNKGLTREDAEMRYLKIAQFYRLFGVDYFVVTCVRMKDPRTLSLTRYFGRAEFSQWQTLDCSQELSWVGITAAGIQFFTKDYVDRARYTFPWNIIKNVSYRERKFTIKLNMAWRPTKKSVSLMSSGGRQSSAQKTQQQQPGQSPGGGSHSLPHTPSATQGSFSLPGTPVSDKRAPTRPTLPPPPQPLAFASTTGVSTRYLSAAPQASRSRLVRARSRERPLPSPADLPEPSSQTRESTASYGGSSAVHPHHSTVSASPTSCCGGGGGGGAGVFVCSGVSSAGSTTSAPLPAFHQGATVIEMWLAEPYQAKNIIHLCAGNHSLFMRRRQPDSIDVQQMKIHEREERLRREAERTRLLRERSEKTAALKLNAELESRCAELESALRSSTAAVVAAKSAAPSSPIDGVNSGRGFSKRRTKGEDEEEGEGEIKKEEVDTNAVNVDEEYGELRRRNEVQFSPREQQICPPSPSAYARLRHQRLQRHGAGESNRGNCEMTKNLNPISTSVCPFQAPPHAVPMGIYEGFVVAQSTAEVSMPTQSEPAIPQTLSWSPISVHQAHEDFTPLIYSRPPFLPPRPAMVTQSLEHLPCQQTILNLGQRPRAPIQSTPFPITPTLSLHSGYGAKSPFQHADAQMRGRFLNQGYPSPYNAAFGAATGGRLFNGFSYPGYLNLTGDESGRQYIAVPDAPNDKPTLQAGCQAFDLSGVLAAGIQPTESQPLMGQAVSRKPSFPHLRQSAVWTGGFPLNAYSNPYANYPYISSNSDTPMYYHPPCGYRDFNSVAYYDANASQPGFSQCVPRAPVSMPILNAGDEFYVTGGGETEELLGPSGYCQPPWCPYYDPYMHWLRGSIGFAASNQASWIGPTFRPMGWPQTTAPPLPPPPPPLPPLPLPTNAPVRGMLSPYTGPTRRRIQQQKLAAARQLQRQRQQHHLQHYQQQMEGPVGGSKLSSRREVLRGISLQDLPSRTRSDSESGLTATHMREYSASRPSLVHMPAVTFQPPDAHPHGSDGNIGDGDCDTRLEEQHPPGIFTSPPPPNLLANPISSTLEVERIQLAYQQQMQLHRRMWDEWMWRAGAARPQRRVLGEAGERVRRQHLTTYPSLGDSSRTSLRRMPPPSPPSCPQYVAVGSPLHSNQQYLTPLGGATDIRDPSGPDGSSSVGYMGLDFQGAADAALMEGLRGPITSAEPFDHRERLPDLSSGQHPGSVDRLSGIPHVPPSYVSNGHLYANMTVVNGELVPLMGRPAPVLHEPLVHLSLSPGETGSTQILSNQDASATVVTTTTSIVPTFLCQSRPLTRYHSSQTVWLTGASCDPEVPHQSSEGESPQIPHSRREIPKSVEFGEPY